MNKITVILFSGFNMRALLAFIRTLEENSVSYFIIASSNDDDIFNTSYGKKVIVTRKYKRLDLQDITNSIKVLQETSQTDNYLIAPSTEALNRFLLKHRTVFDQLNCTIPLVKEDLYEQISDKYSFGSICSEYGITIPKEYDDLHESRLPLVAKPKRYFSPSGKTYAPQIIKDIKELETFISLYDQTDFYFQEYVHGRSIYLLYYFDKDKNVYKFSQENLIQQEHGKSMLLAKTSLFHTNEISSKFENLFTSIGFRGLVMIELKLMNNKFYMIEANPRFWGPSQLFVDAEMNFFDCLLEDYNVIKKDLEKTYGSKEIFYFWDDGISKDIDNRKDLAFYNYTRKQFHQNKIQFNQIEIYNRSDIKTIAKGKR